MTPWFYYYFQGDSGPVTDPERLVVIRARACNGIILARSA